MKNASNKNKERTSIAGAIVKLLEKENSSSDGVSANMSMMLMRQHYLSEGGSHKRHNENVSHAVSSPA